MEYEKGKHSLGLEEIDETHKEFIDIYNSVDTKNVESYKNVMTKLLEHTKKHFKQEEELMDKYDYPRKREHFDEHKKVLAEMEYFIGISHSMFGRNMLKSYYKEKLPYWFDLHLASMDSDLTAHIKSKKSS